MGAGKGPFNKTVQNNYMAFFGGHDAAFCIYSAETDQFFTLELEKILGVKHLNWPKNWRDFKLGDVFVGDQNVILRRVRDEVVKFGLKPEFRHVILGSYNGDLSHAWNAQVNPDILLKYFQVDNISINTGHHTGHAWGAVAQLPPSKGVLITTDGGGDDGYFSVSLFDREKSKYRTLATSQNLKHGIGGKYEDLAHIYLDHIVQSTPMSLDLSGKVMGAAAFGMASELPPTPRWANDEYQFKKITPEVFLAFREYGENNRYRFLNKNHLTWEEEVNRCASIQAETERLFQEALFELCPNIEQLIKDNDNNLLFSGGYSLNITNNKKLAEQFDCNIWVPPNPGDNGLPFGFLYKWLVANGRLEFNSAKRYDNSTIGPKVRDLDRLEEYMKQYEGSHKVIDLKSLSEFIKQGEIIAVMVGNSETGFRALGNRSILCDASIDGIKEKVNLVKRREPYRPFAPMCLWENAHEWFVVGNENVYRHMNIAVDVLPNANLPAITHVDGTARLQAVDFKGFAQDLLRCHQGVILNTSFNLAGKPICNSLYEAFHILERTPLDKLIIEKNGELHCFGKYIE